MKSSLFKKTSAFISIFVAAFVVFQLGFIFSFMHFHISPAGEYVVHSHPVKRTPLQSPKYPGHTHDSFELLFYSKVSLVDRFVIIFPFILIPILVLLFVFTFSFTICPKPPVLFSHDSRSPPPTFATT